MFTEKGGDKGKAAKSKKECGVPKLVEHSVWLCVDDKRLHCCVPMHTYFSFFNSPLLWCVFAVLCGSGVLLICAAYVFATHINEAYENMDAKTLRVVNRVGFA